METPKERRSFKRISFKAKVTLTIGEQTFACELIDISLNGALIKMPMPKDLHLSDEGLLNFELADVDLTITMHIRVMHTHNFLVGLKCLHIDIESISHLRRLIELNCGDSEQLSRELQALLEQN